MISFLPRKKIRNIIYTKNIYTTSSLILEQTPSKGSAFLQPQSLHFFIAESIPCYRSRIFTPTLDGHEYRYLWHYRAHQSTKNYHERCYPVNCQKNQYSSDCHEC